ncbi:MAG: hypothetical protein R6V45_05765 [Oceanipulchritudo sp.]
METRTGDSMKTERLMQSGILNSGEPRHYASWEAPRIPRLDVSFRGSVGEALNRRRQAAGPQRERPRKTFRTFLQALGKR